MHVSKGEIHPRQSGDDAPSDHAIIKLVLKTATSLMKKKLRFNVRPKKKKRKKKDLCDYFRIIRKHGQHKMQCSE
jgi:hypothetical protein